MLFTEALVKPIYYYKLNFALRGLLLITEAPIRFFFFLLFSPHYFLFIFVKEEKKTNN